MLPSIIALFVKPPIPGVVKTRLAHGIGAQRACSVYQQLADTIIHHIQVSGTALALFFDGKHPEAVPDDWLRAAVLWAPQRGNDLGERMAAAFQHLFTLGITRVFLVGSDIHGLDAAYLQQASTLLEDHDLVLGPTFDGGYCLIGCSQAGFRDGIFQGISWSTDQVLRQTLAKADAAGLSSALLPYLRDIDTLADLQDCNLQLPDP